MLKNVERCIQIGSHVVFWYLPPFGGDFPDPSFEGSQHTTAACIHRGPLCPCWESPSLETSSVSTRCLYPGGPFAAYIAFQDTHEGEGEGMVSMEGIVYYLCFPLYPQSPERLFSEHYWGIFTWFWPRLSLLSCFSKKLPVGWPVVPREYWLPGPALSFSGPGFILLLCQTSQGFLYFPITWSCIRNLLK